MKPRRAPQLAAAFVVTLSACSSEPPPLVNPPGPDVPLPQSTIQKNPDGSCTRMISGNPPSYEPVPCPPDTTPTASSTFAAPPDGTPTATQTVAEVLPPAPAGWNVRPNPDGTCTAYGPDPCNHPGCNPPPPRQVACPVGLTK